MKRDSLSRCHGVGKNEKILRVTVLAIELDGEWPASSRTSAAHKVFAITLLQNQRTGRCGALRSLVVRLWSGALAHSGAYKYSNGDGRQHQNERQDDSAHVIPFRLPGRKRSLAPYAAKGMYRESLPEFENLPPLAFPPSLPYVP